MAKLTNGAMLSAALFAPAAGFTVSPQTGRAVSRSSTAAAVQPQATEAAVPEGAMGATVLSAGALAAATGAAALAARRRRTAMQVKLKPRLVINWQVDPKFPEPGSEKALATMVGADVEMGDAPWDPMGFSKLYDRNFDFNNVMTYPHVQWLREAELKHGRICMLAFLGIIVPPIVHIPGLPVEPEWSKALYACYMDKTASIGIAQISLFAMLMEGRWYPGDAWIGQMDREPGDLGWDPLKLTKAANYDLKTMQLKELKNGRLAMVAVGAFFAAHNIPGSVPGIGATSRDKVTTTSASFCGASSTSLRPVSEESKTAARYTTQVVLPSLTWVKSGVKASDLAPTQLKAKNLVGTDVLVGKDESGKVFCVGNLCPHIGTPMSEGADVIGDIIVCPLHGSSFKTTTGELIDWCVSPPIIGPLTGLVIEKKNLAVFDTRTTLFGGGEIEVLIDVNAKKAYEADYWKGLLDAQGKDDGSIY